MTALDLPSPLGFARRLEGAGIGGRIKERPEDFLVEELPLYEPSGAGEHLMLRVQKMGLSHGELVRRIARHFEVPEGRIGFAGMKDKHAVTVQCVTVHSPRDFEADETIDERIAVLWAARHSSKVRRGHLAGNRFSIKVRGVDPLKAPVAARRLRELAARGAANFIGPQRFGYRRNNHILGILMLREDWQGLLDELLGTRGSPFPDHQREARGHYDAGGFADALALWRRADRAECSALRELTRGGNARRACMSVGKRALSFFGTAAQSAVFNRVLDERMRAGSIDSLQEGDLAWVHRSRAVFAVDEEELANPDLAKRVAALELSPSGPMWGAGMTQPSGAVREREHAALASLGLMEDHLQRPPCELEGARRALRCRIEDTLVDAGFDEHGGFVRLAFDLERGSFATVILREIMGEEKSADSHAEEDVESG